MLGVIIVIALLIILFLGRKKIIDLVQNFRKSSKGQKESVEEEEKVEKKDKDE